MTEIWLFLCPQGQPGQFSERMSGSLRFPCANTLGTLTCRKCAGKEEESKFLTGGYNLMELLLLQVPKLGYWIWRASYHTRESGGIRGWSFTLENPSTANKHLYPLMDWCSLLHVSEIRERAFKHHGVKSISNISKAQKLLGAFKNILGVQNDWMVDFKLTSVDRWNSFPEILQWKFLPP